MAERSLQAQIPHNHCFGCGPDNPAGLNLESFATDEGVTVAQFVPQQHHCAGPAHFVNGGILATLIDCHAICTAIAHAYVRAGRTLGSAPLLHCATAQLSLEYLRPTPIDAPLSLRAQILSDSTRQIVVGCTLSSRGKIRVTAQVTAVPVSDAWMQTDNDK